MNTPPISPDQYKKLRNALSDSSFNEWNSIKDCIPDIDDSVQKKLYAWKKADVYKDNLDKAPKWLADEFNIMWIKYSEFIPEGFEMFTPYSDHVFSRLLTMTEEANVYDEVILWKHKDHGEDVLDIDLTMRSFLNDLIEGK